MTSRASSSCTSGPTTISTSCWPASVRRSTRSPSSVRPNDRSKIHIDGVADQNQPAFRISDIGAEPVPLAVEPKNETFALVGEANRRIAKWRDLLSVFDDADDVSQNTRDMDGERHALARSDADGLAHHGAPGGELEQARRRAGCIDEDAPLADRIQNIPIREAVGIDRRHWNAHHRRLGRRPVVIVAAADRGDRKSTRLNSSHVEISYAVFCLKKKKNIYTT